MATTDLDTSLLITEDGKPVDNLFVEKEYRLLTEPLWTSWKAPEGRLFRVLSNVGFFFEYKEPPLVPDVMFAIDAESPRETRESDYRSYFLWIVGKPPDIVIEIVSDKRGREDTDKLLAYQRLGVPFYVIFDPDQRLKGGLLRAFELRDDEYAAIEPNRFGELGLGLTLWQGEIEGGVDTWLRWVDGKGKLIPNAKERAEAEMKRANAETKRAEVEAKRAEVEAKRAENEAKRAENEAKRAEVEAKRAEVEAKRADSAEARNRYLEEKLRAAGISNNGAP